MLIKVLSSKEYENNENNHGDCFIIDNGSELIIYDCGSVEHADRVIEYMNEKGYKTANAILSHNDSDHFNGIEYLVNKGKVKYVYTTLLLKHLDDIEKLINDGRRKKKALEN